MFFNATAYSNEAVTLDWIKIDLCYMTSDFDRLQPERLVTLDIFAGQTTEAVQNLMKELHITPVYIPEGCTGYIQPLDTILNKLLKDRIAADLDEEVIEDAVAKAGESYEDSVGTRRIAITHAVGRAWEWLHQEKRASIVKAFEQTGTVSHTLLLYHLMFVFSPSTVST